MDPLYTPLHKAVRSGNIQDVKALISSGVEIDAKGKTQEMPLFEAARNNLVSIAKLLLQNGADVNARDSVLQTPLHFSTA